MRNVFGKSVLFPFSVVIDNDRIPVHSLLSARIYSTQPTEAQIEDAGQLTTGHVERVTAWTDEGDHNLISFAALADTAAHSPTRYETFYVVVNFRFRSAGIEKWAVEPIRIYRPDAVSSRVTVTHLDVFNIEPRLKEINTPADIEKFIAGTKKEDVFQRYDALDRPLQHLFDLEHLNNAVKCRAAALACMSHYTDRADHWRVKYDVRTAQYELAFTRARPGFDAERNSTPSPDERGSRTIFVVR